MNLYEANSNSEGPVLGRINAVENVVDGIRYNTTAAGARLVLTAHCERFPRASLPVGKYCRVITFEESIQERRNTSRVQLLRGCAPPTEDMVIRESVLPS